MNEKKYYCLKMGGIKNYTLLTNSKITVIPNVLEKNYTNLDVETLRDDFFMLDNNIIVNKDTWTVQGKFPVIATIENDIMKDAITGIEIEKYNKDIDQYGTLIYSEKYPIPASFAKTFLSLVDDEAKKRYQSGIDKILKDGIYDLEMNIFNPKYYRLEMSNIPENLSQSFPVYARDINGTMYDELSNTAIYQVEDNTISLELTYEKSCEVSAKEVNDFYNSIIPTNKNHKILQNLIDFQEINPEILRDLPLYANYLQFINKISTNTVKKYNFYTTIDLPKIASSRLKSTNNKIKIKK